MMSSRLPKRWSEFIQAARKSGDSAQRLTATTPDAALLARLDHEIDHLRQEADALQEELRASESKRRVLVELSEAMAYQLRAFDGLEGVRFILDKYQQAMKKEKS